MIISWNTLGSVDEQHRYLVGIQFGTQFCDTKECETDVPDSPLARTNRTTYLARFPLIGSLQDLLFHIYPPYAHPVFSYLIAQDGGTDNGSRNVGF